MRKFLMLISFLTLLSCKGERKIIEEKTPINDSISLVSMRIENQQEFKNDTLDIAYLETNFDFIDEKEKAQANEFLASVLKDGKILAKQNSKIVKNDKGILTIITEQQQQNHYTYQVNHYDIMERKEIKASDIFYPKNNYDDLIKYINEKKTDLGLSSTDENLNFVFDEKGNFILYADSGEKVELSKGEVGLFVGEKWKYRFGVPPSIDCSNVPCVALTFDDGPGAYTGRLLNILEENDAKATFFVLGKLAEMNPAILQRMKKEGHQIENHSWSHKNLKAISNEDIKFQINNTNQKIQEIIGENPKLLRPPYGNFNDFIKNNFDMPIILWSLDTYDWKDRRPNAIIDKMEKARNGDIILLHDIHKTTVDAMPIAIKRLKDKGFHLVTLEDLLYGKDIKNKVVHSKNYQY